MDRYQHTCRVCGWQAIRTEALGYCESCAERRPATIRVTAGVRLICSSPSTTPTLAPARAPTRRPLRAIVGGIDGRRFDHMDTPNEPPELPPAA